MADAGLRATQYVWFPDLALLDPRDDADRSSWDDRYDQFVWMWTPTIRWVGDDRWRIVKGDADSSMPEVWCELTGEWARDFRDSRDDDFIALTRYSLDEAKTIVERLAGELIDYLVDTGRWPEDD